MKPGISYNRIAGTSVERLAALSDGIFAVAMTLLLLDLKVPAHESITESASFCAALGGLLPEILVYLMSFITLGIFWVGQQTQLNNLERSDRHLTWIHLAFLFLVTLLPFTTRLLIEYIDFRAALVVYWLNILFFGAMLYASWARAMQAGLVKEAMTSLIARAICQRILVAQSLYAFGALLCLINTYVSIVFITVVQLNYAIAPGQWRRTKPVGATT